MNVLLGVFTLVLLWNFSSARPNSSTLKLVHVLHRHGDRNPDQSEMWTTNRFYNESFYPEGYGQLTNQGKRTVFNLGRLLRKRFDKFLGDIWNINYLDVRSTDTNRTKMSAQLVLAGLWPPKRENIWNRQMSWQPIPINYVSTSADPVLNPSGCSSFSTKLANVLALPEISSYLTRYDETLQILNNSIGVNTLTEAVNVYFGLYIQNQLGLPLDDWTKQVYPEPLHSLAVDAYYIVTNTTELRQLMAGSFLKKVLSDTESFINGTLTPLQLKMFVYSAHEINVGSVLLALDAFKLVEVPPYGSHVIFEVHEIDGVYGFKIFYGDYTAAEPHGPLVIPGCAEFCPFDEFSTLVAEILPSSDAICYGS